MVNEIKVYRTKAHFKKNKRKINFTFECRAHKVEEVLERIYSEIGSRHNVKRTNIFVPKEGAIVEIDVKDASYSMFRDMDEPDFKIYI